MTKKEWLVYFAFWIIVVLAAGCTVRCYKDGVYVWRKTVTRAQRDTMDVWKGE